MPSAWFLGNDPIDVKSEQGLMIIESAGNVVRKVQCDRTRTDQTTHYDIGFAQNPEYEESFLTDTLDTISTAHEQNARCSNSFNFFL